MTSPVTLTVEPGRRYRGSQLTQSEKAAAIGVVVLLFLEHLAFGGGRKEIAFAFAAVQGMVLVGLLVAAPWAKRDMAKAPALAVPALLFGLVYLATFWALTPFVPGGPQPIWQYLPAPRA